MTPLLILYGDGSKRIYTNINDGRNGVGNQGAFFHPDGK